MGKRKREDEIVSTDDEATLSSNPQLEAIITEEGILSSILSKLPLKEAVKTCLLSRRWKHIWTHRPNLKFDADNMFAARCSRYSDNISDSDEETSDSDTTSLISDSEEETDDDSDISDFEEETDDDSDDSDSQGVIDCYSDVSDSEEETDDNSEAEEVIDHLDIDVDEEIDQPNIDVDEVIDHPHIDVDDELHHPDIDADEEIDDYEVREKDALVKKNEDKFIASVNSVLQQHQGARVEEFTVTFLLNKTHSHNLDEWLRFAAASKTRKLDLDLGPPWLEPSAPLEPYDFPFKLFAKHKGSSIEDLSLATCSFRLIHGFDCFNNLKELNLLKVDVTDPDMSRLLLSNCFTLESLEVSECQQLVTLSTDHALSQLDNLSVTDCNKLRKIEMDAINLTKLFYTGVWVDIVLTKSPRLSVAHFSFSTGRNGVIDMDSSLTKLSSNLPNIEDLSLYITDVSKVANLPKDSISFIRLRSFTWKLDSKMRLPYLASLLSAAPFLTVFKFSCSVRVTEEPPQELRKLERLPKHPHLHLKKVKIGKFYGDKWQLETALHLLKNAIELESMKIKMVRHRKGSSEEIHEKFIQYMTSKAPSKCQIIVK